MSIYVHPVNEPSAAEASSQVVTSRNSSQVELCVNVCVWTLWPTGAGGDGVDAGFH